jgi:hypothetical protein
MELFSALAVSDKVDQDGAAFGLEAAKICV